MVLLQLNSSLEHDHVLRSHTVSYHNGNRSCKSQGLRCDVLPWDEPLAIPERQIFHHHSTLLSDSTMLMFLSLKYITPFTMQENAMVIRNPYR